MTKNERHKKKTASWHFLKIACIIICVATIGLNLLLAGCSSEAETTPEAGDTTPGDTIEKEPVVIHVGMGSFGYEQLDPLMADGVLTLSVLVTMYDTLLEVTPDGGVAPGIAEKWEVADDNLTWTFYLRQGVQFHDGWGELTAEDVKFSLERQAQTKSTNAGSYLNKIEEITILDPYTIQIRNKEIMADMFPFPLFSPLHAGGMIVCKNTSWRRPGRTLKPRRPC